MSERLNTAEGVEQDYRYLMFDLVADEYLEGKISLEQAAGKWACYELALDAPRPANTRLSNLD